jgi:hypothetical protein
VPQRFVGNYVWQMPFFAGRGPLVRTVAAGWSLSGIATIQTGLPVNVTISQDQANTGRASQRPDRVGTIHAESCGRVLVNCVNTSAFAMPALYTYGNTARNALAGPGYVNFDTALAKTFRVHEGLGFKFRVDAYNTFNHPNLGASKRQLLIVGHLWQYHDHSYQYADVRIYGSAHLLVSQHAWLKGMTQCPKSHRMQSGLELPCSENRRWIVGKVMYAVLNIQGSCDNLCDDYPDPVEEAARKAANIAWMQGTFQTAIDQRCVAVMFISQADPGWDDTDGTRAPTRNAQTLIEDDAQKATDGFGDFLRDLRPDVIAFGKPVAYVNGDSHYFRVDKPLLDTAGKRVVNFTRVETFGDHQPFLGDVNWLKVNVDPSSREVFSYETQIVNRDVLVP